jgi:D-alanine-D-alanine ligase
VHAAQVAGYGYDALINRMLDVATVRYFGDAHEEESERARIPTARRRPLSVRVRSYMRSQAANIDEALQQLVDLPSPATDPDQVNAAADWFSRKLELVGFRETVHPFVRLGNARFYSNHDGDEHDVLLLGHIDTRAALRFRRFQHEGRRVYGTGVLDGKGGLVVGLAALRALRHSRVLRRLRVGFLVTTDATEDGREGAALVRQYAKKSTVVLGLQGGDEDGSFFGSRSGRATYRVSASFPKGTRELPPDRAVRSFVSRLLATQHLANENVRIAVTRMEVDAPFEHLPETATATITVRFNDSAAWPELEQAVRAALTRRTSGMRMTVHGGLRRPPLERTEGRDALIAEVERLAKSINVPTKAAHMWGSTNVGFVPNDVPAVDGLGPVGSERASADEHIFLGSLTERAALVALLIDAKRRARPRDEFKDIATAAPPETHAAE